VVQPTPGEVGTTAVLPPPVPRLPLHCLDVAHLRFFDDDSSEETYFGRTLDTISEEEDDADDERVAVVKNDELERVGVVEYETEEADASCSAYAGRRPSTSDLAQLASSPFQFQVYLL